MMSLVIILIVFCFSLGAIVGFCVSIHRSNELADKILRDAGMSAQGPSEPKSTDTSHGNLIPPASPTFTQRINANKDFLK